MFDPKSVHNLREVEDELGHRWEWQRDWGDSLVGARFWEHLVNRAQDAHSEGVSVYIRDDYSSEHHPDELARMIEEWDARYPNQWDYSEEEWAGIYDRDPCPEPVHGMLAVGVKCKWCKLGNAKGYNDFLLSVSKVPTLISGDVQSMASQMGECVGSEASSAG